MIEPLTLKPVQVDWQSLWEAVIQRNHPYTHCDFLDTETGQTIFLHEEVVGRIRNESAYVNRMLPPWVKEDLPKARQVLADKTGRYLLIPEPDSDEWYRARLDFTCHPEVSMDMRLRLLDALDGSGAFRRFQAVLRDAPQVRKCWDSFEKEWTLKWLHSWLRSVGIDAALPAPNRRSKRR